MGSAIARARAARRLPPPVPCRYCGATVQAKAPGRTPFMCAAESCRWKRRQELEAAGLVKRRGPCATRWDRAAVAELRAARERLAAELAAFRAQVLRRAA